MASPQNSWSATIRSEVPQKYFIDQHVAVVVVKVKSISAASFHYTRNLLKRLTQIKNDVTKVGGIGNVQVFSFMVFLDDT